MFRNYLLKSKDKGHEDNNAISEIISTHFSNQSWDIKFVDRKGRGDFPIHYSNIELTKIYHFLLQRKHTYPFVKVCMYVIYLICVSNETNKQISKYEISETKEQRVKERTYCL